MEIKRTHWHILVCANESFKDARSGHYNLLPMQLCTCVPNRCCWSIPQLPWSFFFFFCFCSCLFETCCWHEVDTVKHYIHCLLAVFNWLN